MKIFYEAKAHSTGGRGGRVTTDDGVLDLQLSIPQKMGGAGGEGTNPEQLFAAGYAACFDSALNHIAGLRKVDVESTAVDATVGIGQHPEGGFGLAVTLEVTIVGPSREQAEELVQAAHAACPYSNAIRNNVDVRLVIIG
ncbi:MAG: organic hydroperoxide resistance protein [Armatimonas sp.]